MLDRTATAVQDLPPNARRAKGDVRTCTTFPAMHNPLAYGRFCKFAALLSKACASTIIPCVSNVVINRLVYCSQAAAALLLFVIESSWGSG